MLESPHFVRSDLVERIYDAPLPGASWAPVTEGLMEELGGVQGLLGRFDPHAHEMLAKSGSIDDSIVALCQAEYNENPWVDSVLQAPPGRIVALDSYMRLTELEKTGFYADILRPSGVAHCIGAVLRSDEDAWLSIGFGRSRQAGRFEQSHLDMVAAYLPHLRRAAALADRLDGFALIQNAELEALDMLGTGVVLVDATGCVLLANRAARALAGSALRLPARRMPGCADRGAAPAFRAAVLAAVAGQAPSPVRFRDTADAPVIMVAAPIGAGVATRLMTTGGLTRPAAVLFLLTAAGQTGPSIPLLQALWGLTPTEARVAAELAFGDEEVEVARRLRIGPSSLKTHRRRIFEKVGVKRRGQLIRILARLPISP